MGRLNKRRRLLVTWTIRSLLLLGGIIALAIVTLPEKESAVLPGEQVEGLTSVLSRSAVGEAPTIRFKDVTSEAGVAFRHFPAQRASLLPEDMGSGVACGDFDNDGLPDLFFVNFAGSILKPLPLDSEAARCRLFRNVGGMHFEDVTEQSGLGIVAFGMGAAWGDFDNDGDLDIYITTFGQNRLFENRGEGKFVDSTTRAGVGDSRFGAGCAWSDYDRDGDLDLYVSNYVDFVFRDADLSVTSRQYGSEQPYTLNPSAYKSQPNALFRNRGDGTFEEVARFAGVDDPEGRSLSVSWVDYNDDGWPDLYVANDVSNNGVFLNKGDGTFEDVGPSSLAADYRGAMGIAVADFDHDLDLDLMITHWIAQENALYRNMLFDTRVKSSDDGRVWFLDSADAVGLGQSSLDMIGWATGFADFDNDGRRDLWIINGSTFEVPDNHQLLKPQRPFIYRNRGDDGFVEVAGQVLGAAGTPFVGRGGVQADLDRDGLVDLVWLVRGGNAMVLKNVSEAAGHWLSVDLRQSGGNVFALGARVYVTLGGTTQMGVVGSSPSYLSQEETVMHFGLGEKDSIDTLRIVWPDGTEESHADLPVDQLVTFSRGVEDTS